MHQRCRSWSARSRPGWCGPLPTDLVTHCANRLGFFPLHVVIVREAGGLEIAGYHAPMVTALAGSTARRTPLQVTLTWLRRLLVTFKVGSGRLELLAVGIARICLAMVGRALHAQTRPFPRLPLHRSHQRVQTRPVVCLTRKDPEQAHRPRCIARARGGGVERGGTPKAEAVPQFRNWVRVP